MAIRLSPELCWPRNRGGEALLALAESSGLARQTLSATTLAEVSRRELPEEELDHWLAHCAALLGVELESFETPYADVLQALPGAAPALLRVRSADESHLGERYLAIVGQQRNCLVALAPSGEVFSVDIESVRAALCHEQETDQGPLADQLLLETGIAPRRRASARSALLRELLLDRRVPCGWLVRCGPTAPVVTQARELRLGSTLLALLAAHSGYFTLWIVSWFLLGSIALAGHLELGWMLAWTLVLVTVIPLRLFVTRCSGRFAVGMSVLVKRRLLWGALQLDADQVRRQGAGSLLGRILEAEVLDTLATTGGALSLTAAVELVLAAFVLYSGAAGTPLVALLLVTLLVTALLCRWHYGARQHWTDNRFVMTDDLVERMVGHRTRLAQQPLAHWHIDEDQMLAQHAQHSQRMDKTAQRLKVLPPRGWLLVSIGALVPSFVVGQSRTIPLAIAVGGILLAFSALKHLVEGLEQLTAAGVAWQRLKVLWGAAAAEKHDAQNTTTYLTAGTGAGQPLVDAQQLVYRYPGRKEPVLRGVDLRIHRGDQVLLAGDSGSGKTTLAAVLADLRPPESGLLLLDGLDRQTVGPDSWRRRVVLAPQFHENHVLMGSLAFNLLLGRRWPPRDEDLADASRICNQLGLGPLLERMPGGLFQLVGETGWQLSHGEKNRLFVARALLQGTDLVILDESLAALDPKTLKQTAESVLSKAGSLMLIAHP